MPETTHKVEIGRVPDAQVDAMQAYLQQLADEDDSVMGLIHMDTMRRLLASHDAAWTAIEAITPPGGGVEHG